MKTALITGGAGGIGSAVCRQLAKNGYGIAIHYHERQRGAALLAGEIRRNYQVNVNIYQADLSDYESTATLFDNFSKDFTSLDALVNNAGKAQQRLFTDITPQEWRSMLATNLDSVFYCSREALRRFMLPAHSGAIVNISSMWGQVGASCEVHYSASKAGVIGLTKALAKEVGLSGVRVNCVAPGVVMTDMMKGFDSDALAALREETPLNALGTPDQVAEAVAFLCSDRAGFITGQVLGVNGGFVI